MIENYVSQTNFFSNKLLYLCAHVGINLHVVRYEFYFYCQTYQKFWFMVPTLAS